MRILHTSDWHAGKAIRGRSRADEHTAVLAEIAAIADRERADLVLVGGDLFDSSAPPPEAEQTVYRALLDLTAERTRPVVVISGNHDAPSRLAAVAPVFAAHGVRIVSTPTRPEDGGVVEIGAARIALLPFPSQRSVVTADALMTDQAGDHGLAYAGRVARLLDTLAAGFDGDAVNVVLAHLMVMGGTMGGGERGAHTVFEYWVPSTAFPPGATYVALGHLHRAQSIEGPAPLHYCGSPLQLDFGETANAPSVNLVEAEPGTAGVKVERIPLTTGRRLRALEGTPDQLLAQEGTTGDDHLKLVVDSPPRPGLADELRERFPTAVEVVLARTEAAARGGADAVSSEARSPHELFTDYLAHAEATDERLVALFDELVDEVSSP